MESAKDVVFDQWAIVDVMGHQRYVGRVTEQVIAGQGFVRIDVPATETRDAWTKIIGTGSIYAITPVSERIAIAMVAREDSRPISAYDLPSEMRPLLAGRVDSEEDEDSF